MANRLLVERMQKEGMDTDSPGVTEAGAGEDGRLKSAIGIGSLLADGIGDTIRVSITEDPEFEIPVAYGILQAAGPGSQKRNTSPALPAQGHCLISSQRSKNKRNAPAT